MTKRDAISENMEICHTVECSARTLEASVDKHRFGRHDASDWMTSEHSGLRQCSGVAHSFEDCSDLLC